jgi:hypothetical protein
MEKNEVKKLLYKEDPKACLLDVAKDGIRYLSEVSNGKIGLTFLVPLNEMGETKWKAFMDARLLIRYIESIQVYLKPCGEIGSTRQT